MNDTEIAQLIKNERARQKRAINLIASENYVSRDVLAALGSEFTNKYAEGYPGRRYYGGNEVVDQVENLCKERALNAFKLSSKNWHVNVQPLSGSPANLAAYLALMPKGGTIMGMELASGGHLTHGHDVSASGIFWDRLPYGVNESTERLDYETLKRIAKKHKPDVVVAGYTAYPRKVNWKQMREVADAAEAYLLVDMSHIAGLVAGGVHPKPFAYADVVTTTVHKTLRGPRAALIFARTDERKLDTKIDKAVFPGLQGGPHVNQIAASAVALSEAAQPAFKTYAKHVVANARALASELQSRGWRIVTSGTDTHLLLVDTWMDGLGVSGKTASEALEARGYIANKNTIPFDTRSPADPSGLRLGAAAETTRGKTEKDFVRIARDIDAILNAYV